MSRTILFENVLTLFRGLVIAALTALLLAAAKSPAKGAEVNVAEEAQSWKTALATLASDPTDEDALKNAVNVAKDFEKDPATYDLAIQAFHDLSVLFAKNKDPELAAKGPKFAGIARRLDLPGRPMKFKAKTIGGKPFDVTQWKGKVVLVDFSATWCGPCNKELPNVKHNYDVYHARGFEVVGVSLDDEPDTLKQFISDKKIPWPVIFSPNEHGFDMPVALHYGITSIPCAILLNRQGIVVSMKARGPELTHQLEQLIGPAEAGAAK